MPEKIVNQRLSKVEKRVHALELKIGKPRENNIESDAKQEQAKDERTEIQPSSPALPDGDPPQVQANNSQAKWYTSFKWWRQQPFTWWKDRAEFLAFIFAVAYAVVTFFQWRDLRHNFKEEQRPYLAMAANQTPQAAIGTTKLGATFTAQIPFINFGKSPAVHVFRAFEILVPEKSGGDPESRWEEVQSRSDAWFKETGIPLKKTLRKADGLYAMANGIAVAEDTVMPGAPYPFMAIQAKNFDASPHYPGMIVARVEYRDGAGNLYWTDLCYTIGQQFGADGKQTGIVAPPCPKHNEIH